MRPFHESERECRNSASRWLYGTLPDMYVRAMANMKLELPLKACQSINSDSIFLWLPPLWPLTIGDHTVLSISQLDNNSLSGVRETNRRVFACRRAATPFYQTLRSIYIYWFLPPSEICCWKFLVGIKSGSRASSSSLSPRETLETTDAWLQGDPSGELPDAGTLSLATRWLRRTPGGERWSSGSSRGKDGVLAGSGDPDGPGISPWSRPSHSGSESVSPWTLWRRSHCAMVAWPGKVDAALFLFPMLVVVLQQAHNDGRDTRLETNTKTKTKMYWSLTDSLDKTLNQSIKQILN